MIATNGKGDRRAKGILFFGSFIRERHRDIKEHSNNKAIINFGLPHMFTKYERHFGISTRSIHFCITLDLLCFYSVPKVLIYDLSVLHKKRLSMEAVARC